ncbi:glyoxalase [Methanofollis aquaemaris]|uniref:Glyoxalase n=1 Tax=Methanofollis aquaemaris TaxID=126734 RepID=A0A8A3S4R1_9EURY|nr:VOC family protein [Methanofollis aquaemaris]QSZ66859.1 glyoxalase [Methanofollis aquaemaris]
MEIAFRGPVLFVKDMERAKEFYIDILEQEVSLDLGVNVGFVGGLALWERGYVNDLLFEGKMPADEGAPRMEVYFETREIKEAARRVEAAGIRFLHPLTEQPWAQMVMRFYDPDGHMIEVAEPMDTTVLRLADEGLSEAEIVERTTLPGPVVAAFLRGECCD